MYCRNPSSLILSFTMVARPILFTINDQGLATFNACQVYKVLPPRHGHLSCFPWLLMNNGLFRFHHCDICIGWYHIYTARIYLYYMCIYKIHDMIMLLIFTVFVTPWSHCILQRLKPFQSTLQGSKKNTCQGHLVASCGVTYWSGYYMAYNPKYPFILRPCIGVVTPWN